MKKNFTYTQEELEQLKSKDKKLARAIEFVGEAHRPVNTDLYYSMVDSIIGQQISTKAHATIRNRILADIQNITPETIASLSREQLQSYGLTFKKVEYIQKFTQKILSKELVLEELINKSDEEIIQILSALDGIGVWSAEMVLLHCLERKDILSYNDLAIRRGICAVYHHKKLDKKLFNKYKKRFSPYGSIASIYFWKISAFSKEELQELDQVVWKK